MRVFIVAHVLVGCQGMNESTYNLGTNSGVKSTPLHAGCGSSFRPVTKAWAQRRSLRQKGANSSSSARHQENSGLCAMLCKRELMFRARRWY